MGFPITYTLLALINHWPLLGQQFPLLIFSMIVGGMIVTDKTHPRRFTAGGFWILYALIFLIGDRLPPAVVDLETCCRLAVTCFLH